MPRSRVLELLQFFEAVESGRVTWPKQMHAGFVTALLKPNGRLDAQAFRPICLKSLLYRLWAGIRSRLRQLAPWLDSQAMGFIPRKEASAMWFCIQGHVELSLQSGTSLAGFSSDGIKAFNNLPRETLLRVAANFGMPDCLLVPWCGFLDGVQRYFKVRDGLSEGILCSSGFPEGDPLSPLAIVLANAIFHAYMREFAPQFVHSPTLTIMPVFLLPSRRLRGWPRPTHVATC